jgi:hypothetical protein
MEQSLLPNPRIESIMPSNNADERAFAATRSGSGRDLAPGQATVAVEGLDTGDRCALGAEQGAYSSRTQAIGDPAQHLALGRAVHLGTSDDRTAVYQIIQPDA